MGKINGLDDLLESIVKTIKDGDYDKKPLGTISEALRLKFLKMGKEKSDMAEEMKTRKTILEAEMEFKLYKEFNDRIEEYSELKETLWSEATQELGIPEDGNYTCDFKSGVVSEKIPKQKNPGDIFMENLKKNRRM